MTERAGQSVRFLTNQNRDRLPIVSTISVAERLTRDFVCTTQPRTIDAILRQECS